MKRVSCTPRDAWQSRVERVGVVYHTVDGRPYWDESAYYSLTMPEVLALEAATNELQRLCLEAGQHIIDRNRFKQFGLSEAQLDDAEHGEERAEQQRELDEIEHGLETAGEQHEVRDRKLEKDGIGRRSAGRFAGEYPQ